MANPLQPGSAMNYVSGLKAPSEAGRPEVSDYLAPAKDLERIRQRTEEARQKGEQALGALEAEAGTLHSKYEAARDKLGPMPMGQTPTKSPEFHEIDPMKAWGSAAMMVAVFGSMLTRRPMEAAMNAAASALKAYHQRDMDTFNLQFKKWQIEQTNAQKMFNYETAAYSKALSDLSRQEGAEIRENQAQQSAVRAQISALSFGFKDAAMQEALRLGGLKAAENLIKDRENHFANIARSSAQIMKGVEESTVISSFLQSPEGQDLLIRAPRDTSALKVLSDKISEFSPTVKAARDRAYASSVNQASRQLASGQVGIKYSQYSDIDGIIKAALKQLQDSHGAGIDGPTKAALYERFSKANAGGVARSFMIKLLQDSTSYPTKIQHQIANKMDDRNSGLPGSLTNLLIERIIQEKNDSHTLYLNEVRNAADRLDKVFGAGAGDVLRTSAPYLTPKDRLPTSSGQSGPQQGGHTLKTGKYNGKTVFQGRDGHWYSDRKEAENAEGGTGGNASDGFP